MLKAALFLRGNRAADGVVLDATKHVKKLVKELHERKHPVRRWHGDIPPHSR